jgi:hypothetical protein
MIRGARNIVTLPENAIPRLAFPYPEFARNLLWQFTGEQRQRIVEALADQARRLSGGVYAGNPADHMAAEQRKFAQEVAAFLDEAGLEDLGRALRRLT